MRRASDQIEKPMQYQKSFLMAGSALALAMSGAPALADADQTQAAHVEDVVVVGSRIRRDVYNSPSPVQVVTREDAVLQGYASTAEILQSTAITGGATQVDNARTGFVVNGGSGVNTVGLRGMGPTRTLVLLNGRRLSPAGTRGSVGAADLNVLPGAMIDRIEVLRDGASSIYGSDAVAGVINLQTRKNFEGLTIDARSTHPLDAGGAGASHRLSVIGGLTGERWRLSGAADYFQRNEMTLRDRGFTQCSRRMLRDPKTGASLDPIDPLTGLSKCYPASPGPGVTINTIATGDFKGVGAVGAVGDTFNRWRPNAAVTQGLVGWEGVGGGNNTIDVRDTFHDSMLNQSLISPVTIGNLYAEGGYRLNRLGDAELYFESMVTRRESYQNAKRQLALDYAVGSPLIPANLAWSVVGRDEGMSKGKDVGVRAFTLLENRAHQDVDFQRHIVGMKGDLNVLPEWRYDVYVSHARSDGEYRQPQFLKSRLSESLDVIKGADGTYRCRELAANPGCLAAPALSTDLVAGKLPADWFAYVSPMDVGVTTFKETVAAVGFDGPLFNLPAGRVMAFVGAEHRRSSLNDLPSEASQKGDLLNYSSAAVTQGSDAVWEVFGEIDAPLLADLPFAQSLNLTASYRFTDYDSYGSDSTYKIGLVWQPTDWMTVRGSYGTSYRAPALFEQFVGASSSFLNSTLDPCNSYGSKDANIRANCAADGLPTDWSQKSSVKSITLGGAEAGLAAETSSNLTIGAVLRPALPAGWGDLALAVDYYEITVKNGVSLASSENILRECYASTPEEFTKKIGLCRLVERDKNSGNLTVTTSYLNLATDRVKGVDYNVRYVNDIGPGALLLNLSVSHQPSQLRKVFASDPLVNQAGFIYSPKVSGAADASYVMGDWRMRWGVDWVGPMEGYTRLKFDPATSIYNLRTPDYFVHHLSTQYAGDGWTATVGVRNLFNTNPPEISANSLYSVVGNSPLMSSYDFAGRTAFINLSRTF